MPPHSPSDPSPRRGGQAGNLNALKHGFYSRIFRKLELGDLKATPLNDLQDEISMLRVVIRRVVELSQGASTLEEYLRLLATLSHATANLGRLVRIQNLIAATHPSEVEQAIEAALKDLAEEWGLNDNPS